MANDNEPAKLLLPYLQRADELQKHEPLVAYYCRLYAMERGLNIPQSDRTKTTNALLVSLMNQLEKDKKSLKLGPDDHLHLEGFALNVFAKADKQDRAGRADLNTAKTFYAASVFFEILNQFGELQPDKQKYAAWKAADIRKAVKEGRKPVPGPPGGDNDFSASSRTYSGEYEDLEPSRNDPPVKPAAAQEPDPSPHYYNEVNPKHAADIPPSPQFYNEVNPKHAADIPPSPQFYNEVNPKHAADIPPSPQFYNEVNPKHAADIPPSPSQNPSPPSYPTASYPSHDLHPPSSTNRSETSTYSQPYHHQTYPQEGPYPQESQKHFPQNYSSHEVSPYSYPNFQSYPSFTDASLPAAPSHYPSYYQGGDNTYSTASAPTTATYPAAAPPPPPPAATAAASHYNSSSRNGTVSEPVPTSVQRYQYDSNYQPTPEKIAEAHKAARFAVGALAFDDVSIAVDYLKKSLELLTNPSAGQ
ncbi:protein HOMOLOG OF MAMMALIAN LYST-INTERACTING PROTEIN 5 isoform X2 [Diospyros lotus]|uniref:protein HOMOLOG OF MAMMALIAN LYST-INTERACTING PROTEIN 5 isoform X2 n=1 Tax=Diospyros lotus TaxID=55363 RepID=UPI00224DA20B|nr:protein HOMOLOG OF MAMMALIAN LYST-INTERACTING PROTEIN 5 isoform X2 [Diospyros lotus]